MKSKRRTTRSTSTADETRAAPRVESTGYVDSEHVTCRCVLNPSIRASVFCGASSSSVHGGEINNSQGDQINGTIIITAHEVHLDMGRSNSDASRETSAVNKSNMSESPGGSPHASTSSTSDRGSILEESSVSTDSGMHSLQIIWV